MLRANEAKIKNIYTELLAKLERIGSMTKDEARQMLISTIEDEVHLSTQKWIQKVEEDVRQVAKEKSIEIVATAMQRYTADQVSAHSSSAVHLPNEEMKGRIIGKEGRNIKALEMATGMEFVIGEAPELITISGFNPIRREIARRALEKLITDGRINPTKIEETVAQCERDLDETIQEYGREVVLEFNLQGVHREIVTMLGKLHFRTSFSQNVLSHSKEVGLFARMIAEELGLDGNLALRAGLFHDIGKAVTAEVEGPHAQIGGEIAKRCGENPLVVNAIAAHHEEVPFESIYAVIVVIADTISASRPGARRETLTAYIKRLEKLEDIAASFEGIKKAYALQAGREVRIIVEEDHMDDEKTALLARNVARKIEQEMNFPGQIKVNVIREKRSIEYAR
jgi:ribonuclease Y